MIWQDDLPLPRAVLLKKQTLPAGQWLAGSVLFQKVTVTFAQHPVAKRSKSSVTITSEMF